MPTAVTNEYLRKELNNFEVNEGYNMINVPVKGFTSGVYMVTMRTNTGISTQKLIVK